jgi:2-dehydropantoate 2-reductase
VTADGGRLQDDVTVVGPGAVGGLLAALLLREGQRVAVVARSDTALQISAAGLTVSSSSLGTWTSRPHVQQHPERGGTALLAVKAPGLSWSLRLLQASPPKEVLTVLNGLGHLATLRTGLPGAHVVPASITVEAVRATPTHIEHRSPFIRLTVPDSALGNTTVLRLAHAGVDVVAGGTETEVLWRKFRFLLPMALLTAHHHLPLGEALLADRQLTNSVLEEVAGVATGAGLSTGAVELQTLLASLPADMRSSLEQDLSAGRPTELAQLGGDLLAAAATARLDVAACAHIIRRLTTAQGSLP